MVVIEALLLANLIEFLWLSANVSWFEQRMDYFSVLAASSGTTPRAGSGHRKQRVEKQMLYIAALN